MQGPSFPYNVHDVSFAISMKRSIDNGTGQVVRGSTSWTYGLEALSV